MFEIGFAGAGGRGFGKRGSTGGIANTEDFLSSEAGNARNFFKHGFLGLGGVLRRLGGEETAGAKERRGASL